MTRYGGMAIFLAIGLGSCATVPPPPLAGHDFADITPKNAQMDPTLVGQRVRWGGTISRVLPGKTATCFDVVEHDLDAEGRPQDDDHSEGRFLACAQGFFEPDIYAPKREITVTGLLQSVQMDRVGQMDYAFPKVAATVVYLWPKSVPVAPPYWGAFPYGDPWMSPWFNPGWGTW